MKKIICKQCYCLMVAFVLFFFSSETLADGIVIDKVYHPYVDALEKELEYRSTFQDTQPGFVTPSQLHKLSVGSALGNSWFAEFYVIAEKSRKGSFSLEAFELELKWQLTEQGEFFIDWGVLFEYEHEDVIQELSVAILAEKEWGRWSGTANLFITEEWGDDIKNELETSLALQARYRYSQAFEPAIELYKGQDSSGLGPVMLGDIRVGPRKKLHWEAGVIFGLSDKSPNQTLRFLFEYEF